MSLSKLRGYGAHLFRVFNRNTVPISGLLIQIVEIFALRLLSVVLGSILYYLVLQVVIWRGIDTDLLKLLSALVVAVFLAVPFWKEKYFNKPGKKGGKVHA